MSNLHPPQTTCSIPASTDTVSSRASFSTWRTFTSVETPKNPKAVRSQLNLAGIKIGDWGDDILERTKFPSKQGTFELVRVSIKGLGLSGKATTAEIYAAGQSQSLSLLPAYIAPLLWLQYPDLLLPNEKLLIAMKQMRDSFSEHSVFHLEHNSTGRWLDAEIAHPDDWWEDNELWAFVRNK